MCGIAGACFTTIIPERAVERALDAMKHRGPDDTAVYRDPSATFAMCRLSIIDRMGGRQPVENEDGSIRVIQNGEIYNYIELAQALRSKGHILKTQSDTEVLVHLYEEYGTEMCRQLRGMFAFAIWDQPRQLLFIGRDRFGKKPLYYTCPSGGGLLFASELKALRILTAAADSPLSIHDQSIYDYLSLGFVPQPATVFKDVFALPEASWMTFDGHEMRIERYWELSHTPKAAVSFSEAAERARDVIAEAVRLRLRSDVPLGVFLSGGIDSSVVAYEAARELGDTLQTFTVAMDSQAYDESALAKETAQQLGVQNTVLHLEVSPLESLLHLVRQYDQPFADSSAIPSLAISRLAREHVTVILNGDGGDELFGGYRRHAAAYYAGKLRLVPSTAVRPFAHVFERMAAHRRSKAGFLIRFLRGLSCPTGEQYLVWSSDMLREADKKPFWLGSTARPTEDWIQTMLTPKLSPFDTQLDADRKINLLSDLLVKMDIATMAASVEGRSPLLDHVVAEFAATLPNHYHIRGMRTKNLLRSAYQDRLPDRVLNGPKRGFEVPLASWLGNELRPLIMDVLGSPSAFIRRYLDGAFLARILDGTLLRERNTASIVYSLLILELWFREFYRHDPSH